MKKIFLAAVFTTATLTASPSVSATTVSNFNAGSAWVETKQAGAGAGAVVSLVGQGGNLENNAPVGTGAAKLTTGSDTGDRYEVGIGGNFGSVGDFLNGGSLSYDYYRGTSPSNNAAAPSIKLTISDGNTSHVDGYATFVYEPYWNINHPAAVNPPSDTWTNVNITGSSGTFWHTAIYGEGSQAGSGNLGKSLTDWNSYFNFDLSDALIIGISIGIGTYNTDVTSYFDNVLFKNGAGLDLAYDFEVSVVPLPAAFPLYGAGVAALGLMGWRRKRKQQAA